MLTRAFQAAAMVLLCGSVSDSALSQSGDIGLGFTHPEHTFVSPHEDPPLSTGGPARITDPALSSYANFTINIVTAFNGGAGNGQNGYNRAAHKYEGSYINPSSYQVRLDARLGLLLSQQPALAHATSVVDHSVPSTIDEFEELLVVAEEQAVVGNGGSDVGAGESLIPEDLVAYQWVIEEVGGQFVDSKLVMRPVSPLYQAVFEVPREGRYRIGLRVVFADGRQGESTTNFDFDDWFVVSLGDSAPAGEGNPDEIGSVSIGWGNVCRNTTFSFGAGLTPRMNNDPVWTEKDAHRSMKSGPALAALSIQHTLGQTWSREPQRFLQFDKIVFASFARSGAEILDGLIAPQGGDGDYIGVGQFEEARRAAAGRRIDVLTISVGGNDAGFAGVLEDLVKKDSVFRAQLVFLGTGDDAEARREIERRLDRFLGVGLPPGQKGDLEVRYDALRDQVESLRQDPGLGEVYISGYAPSLFQIRDENGEIGFRACELFSGPDFDISDRDFATILSRGQLLNTLIKRKAEEFGWHYIDVEADFEGRGYCAKGPERYWVQAEESCQRQGDFRGTMHPNYLGHRAYGLRFSEAFREHTFKTELVFNPESPAAPPPEGVLPTDD